MSWSRLTQCDSTAISACIRVVSKIRSPVILDPRCGCIGYMKQGNVDVGSGSSSIHTCGCGLLLAAAVASIFSARSTKGGAGAMSLAVSGGLNRRARRTGGSSRPKMQELLISPTREPWSFPSQIRTGPRVLCGQTRIREAPGRPPFGEGGRWIALLCRASPALSGVLSAQNA